MQTETKTKPRNNYESPQSPPLKVPPPSTVDKIELSSLMKRFSRNKDVPIIRPLYTIVNRSPSCVNMQHGARASKNFRHE